MSKYASERDEALHELSLDGIGPTTGDVSTWGTHFTGLGRVERSELGERAGDFPEHAWVIVCEDNQGFVSPSLYYSESDYERTFANHEKAYAEFEDGAA